MCNIHYLTADKWELKQKKNLNMRQMSENF